jgi:hypothetical protein
MSFINPFINNSDYRQLFQIRSEVSRCDVQEVVELYSHLDHSAIRDGNHLQEDYYVLFRYQGTNNMMPIRTAHKFTQALSIQVIDTGNETSLQMTSVYRDYLTQMDKINICCGSKTYVLKVEQELYKVLF